jgi:hypothetical protein
LDHFYFRFGQRDRQNQTEIPPSAHGYPLRYEHHGTTTRDFEKGEADGIAEALELLEAAVVASGDHGR